MPLRTVPAAVAVLLLSTVLRAEERLTFERDVRPILKAHCFHCHGERDKKEASLDLRLRRWIVQGGDSGPAVEPGASADSYLLERLRSGEMPPGDGKLPPEDIARIARWIDQGAETARPEPESLDEVGWTREEREFWSFRPIVRPPLPAWKPRSEPDARGEPGTRPEMADADRLVTPVDAFILARLQAEELDFSPPADRATLIRRLCFDLLGLPPTPEQIQRFVEDPAADAYERLVDRLLASPRYGERWGRHWLDVAGYADSEGYTEQDLERSSAFRYRDYVIRAFNADKPYDQFVREQLAGDEQLAPPYTNLSAEQVEWLTATGFLRMAPDGTGSPGVDQDVARNEVLADTIEIVSTSLLGLTIGCARCHDHRYDPISQVDYYRFRAIFEPAYDWKNWRPPQGRLVSLYTDADRQLAVRIEAEAKQVEAERQVKADEYIERTLTEELASLPEPQREPLRQAYRTPAAQRTDAQQELLKQHPSVASISVGSLYLYDRRREERARKLDLERREKERRFVEAARQRELEKVPADVREEVRAARDAAVESRTDRQQELLQAYPSVLVQAETLASVDPEAAAELERDRREAERLRAEKAADDLKRYADRAAEIRSRIPPEGFVRALTERPGQVPPTFLFERGDHQQPGEQVTPAGLSVLDWLETRIDPDDSALPTTGRRAALARQLTSGRHPLLARVLVNRVWMLHFGRGLVATPADFGTLGERPSHPQLLDWMASELMRHDWSLKWLHRQILLSRTYRQSSRRTEQLDRVDPDNRLLGRMNIRRLESEAVRDSLLAVSGRLNTEMFGPPVPVMEDEVGQIVIGKENLDGERKPTQQISLHGQEFRRSLYVQVRRSRPLAVLETFDIPETTPNCTERARSNAAPQSLMLMNSAVVLEAAERFAERLVSEPVASDPGASEAGASGQGAGEQGAVEQGAVEVERIERAWWLAWGRGPLPQETEAARQFLSLQRAAFQPPNGEHDGPAADRLALVSLCQALLSGNRFLYVD